MPQALPYRLHRLLATAVLLLLLGACAVRPPEPEYPPEVEAAREAQAAGELERAAELYLRAADREEPPEALVYRLQAADLLVQAGDGEAARSLVDAVPVEEQPDRVLDWRAAATGGLALLDAAPEQALAAVADRLPTESDALPRLLTVKSEAEYALGELLASAETRVALDPLLTDPDAQGRNRDRIWQILNEVPMPRLRGIFPPAPDTFGAWVELAFFIRSQHLDPPLLEESLRLWHDRYPDHPADRTLVERLVASHRDEARYPGHIAVLLPLSGDLAGPSEAIRDGILAAHYSTSAPRPALRFHDVGEHGKDPWAAYMEAVNDGAELVIGPLRREAVAVFADQRSLPVPVLALNGAPEYRRPPSGLYRFGLLPEDDARSAARQAYVAGMRHAVVLTPSNEWGQRVARAFEDAFEGAGGVVLASATFSNDARDFASPIRRVLGLDLSEQRNRQLRGVTGRNLEFEPRRRQDVDVIFMAAFPAQARQLRPQLRFHHAIGVPVMATSHLYNGQLSDADRDLIGVLFTETPWMLGTEVPEPRQSVLSRALDTETTGSNARLHALGLDAYRLVPQLAGLRADPDAELAGASGRLWIDGSGQVHRQLPLARIHGGGVSVEADPAR
ncbi:MAG: penicillin-binding protein activator [Ectothiorhodospiraceae bacterium]|nr:penicillin-binding protein activator [Ectothiorhodospiraceae bacterium]